MPVFEDRFRVKAPPEAVSSFHRDTRALQQLTPPPIIVQLHRVEPLAEGSQSEFTLWFGPYPIRWLAVHSQVDPHCGFTDTQLRGPMKHWTHTHHWQAIGDGTTEMYEKVEYEHQTGLRGMLTHILFARPFIKLMFAYRKGAIRRHVEV